MSSYITKITKPVIFTDEYLIETHNLGYGLHCHQVHTEERTPRGLLSLRARRCPWKLFSSLLRGRNSFSPLNQWMDSHPCFMPPISFEHCKHFFRVLHILYFEVSHTVPFKDVELKPHISCQNTVCAVMPRRHDPMLTHSY